MPIKREDVIIWPCPNREADDIFVRYYWMKRVRRSRRLSYTVIYDGAKVAWIQCADPFGTKLAKPLEIFEINDAVELCRGYFIEEAPSNIESCAIAKVLRLIPNDWYYSFGVTKKLAIVYQDLDSNQKGVVYQALGFKPYYYCNRARHFSKPKRGNSHGRKILWAKSLRRVNGKHYKVNMPKVRIDIR
jgi:hypothetical protein